MTAASSGKTCAHRPRPDSDRVGGRTLAMFHRVRDRSERPPPASSSQCVISAHAACVHRVLPRCSRYRRWPVEDPSLRRLFFLALRLPLWERNWRPAMRASALVFVVSAARISREMTRCHARTTLLNAHDDNYPMGVVNRAVFRGCPSLASTECVTYVATGTGRGLGGTGVPRNAASALRKECELTMIRVKIGNEVQ